MSLLCSELYAKCVLTTGKARRGLDHYIYYFRQRETMAQCLARQHTTLPQEAGHCTHRRPSACLAATAPASHLPRASTTQ